PRAVCDDGDLIPFVRQGPNLARVRRDIEAGLRDARRVPDREIVEAPHRHPRHDLDLALIVRVILRRLFLRQVRALQVLLDFLGRRRLHLLAARALLRGHHQAPERSWAMRRDGFLKLLVLDSLWETYRLYLEHRGLINRTMSIIPTAELGHGRHRVLATRRARSVGGATGRGFH